MTKIKIPPQPHRRRRRLWIMGFMGGLGVVGLGLGVWFAVYAFELAQIVRREFRPGQWPSPATVYARPLELLPGIRMNPDRLEQELALLKYVKDPQLLEPGTYRRSRDVLEIYTRPVAMIEASLDAQVYRISFNQNLIRDIRDSSGTEIDVHLGLEPAVIGVFSPDHYQDRIPLSLEHTPGLLIRALIEVEDQDFFKHGGVSVQAVARALYANLKAGRWVQGGSTLTQQLIKNLFLVRQKSLKRKVDEMIMAVFLERYATKPEILEAYLNEVYLGQDGRRAIHGFGLAADFYFNRPLAALKPHEIALLVGLLRGPSYYDPRRFPARARERRNVILGLMRGRNHISEEVYRLSLAAEIEIAPAGSVATLKFPAYLDLVKRQLLASYHEETLKTGGLKIMTYFDPQLQFDLEESIRQTLSEIETRRGFPSGELETGGVVAAPGGGVIQALAGGREPGQHGFNRALDANRAIGSLIKPVLYLTALSRPEQYHLMTLIEDAPIDLKNGAGKHWRPENYDHISHGWTPLIQALAHSYNQAAVRLGMELGVETVMEMLRKLGYAGTEKAYPSLFLGGVSMSVLEVAQVYQTLAGGGLYTPLRAIRVVYSPTGEPVQRYPLTVEPVVDPNCAYLLQRALQSVVAEGTAAALKQMLPKGTQAAGKTGTTNDYRDSWFAGFVGNRLAVIWVGRDDHQPCRLSGADGAMRIWGNLMQRLDVAPLFTPQPELITWATVDRETGLLMDPGCESAISVPFIMGFAPTEHRECVQPDQKPFFQWVKELFGTDR